MTNVESDPAPHESFLRRALQLAHHARAGGNHPFGALLVVGGEIVCEAENTVVTGRDRTEHAEMRLIRLAEQTLEPERLRQATLYTSTEPCPMCAGAIYWCEVATVVYAFSAASLAHMAGGGLVIPCRDVFARGTRRLEVVGPLLETEARAVHDGFWQ